MANTTKKTTAKKAAPAKAVKAVKANAMGWNDFKVSTVAGASINIASEKIVKPNPMIKRPKNKYRTQRRARTL